MPAVPRKLWYIASKRDGRDNEDYVDEEQSTLSASISSTLASVLEEMSETSLSSSSSSSSSVSSSKTTEETDNWTSSTGTTMTTEDSGLGKMMAEVTTSLVTTSTESTWQEVRQGVEMIHKTTKLPVHAVFLIVVVIITVIIVSFYCCLRSWWRKFKDSDRGKNFKGIDLKSVNLMAAMGKEKVQPEGEELTQNMEQNETEQGNEEEKEVVNLGKLQYKMDYDFNNNNVSLDFEHF